MKKHFVKALLCLIMSIVITLPLVACGSATNTNTQNPNPENGVKTLDSIAQAEYQTNFDGLRNPAERQDVIMKYLEHHLPEKNREQRARKEALIQELSEINVSDPNTTAPLKNGIDSSNEILSNAATACSLLEFYAGMKDDSKFQDFLKDLGKINTAADMATEFANAYLIVLNLSNNDISDKDKYCTSIIDSLIFITEKVPVYGDYFSKSLEIIKDGTQIVLRNCKIHETRLEAYEEEMKGSTFFSAQDLELTLIPSRWHEEGAPSIDRILRHKDQFDTIPKGEPYDLVKEYILFRVPYEMKNQGTEENDTSAESNKRPCWHDYPDTGKIIKEATCQKEGITRYICTMCKVEKDETIPMLDHIYEDEVIAPTYNRPGYTIHTCKNCGDSYEDSTTDQLTYTPPVISEPTLWFAEGKVTRVYYRFFELRVDSVNGDSISGHLEVYQIKDGNRIYYHNSAFQGQGAPTEKGYVYLLKFDQSVTFGTIPSYTYDQLNIYYNSEFDTFTFDFMYQVTMTRQ